jgi:hypothetical protein
MTIDGSIRVTIRSGIRSGLNPGGGAAPPDPMAGVTRDATSLKYAPSNAAEWATTLAVAGITSGNPASCWTFQELSGDAIDTIGSRPFVAAGTPLYQQTVSGWARKECRCVENTSDKFSATIPAANANSGLVIMYMRVHNVPSVVRKLFEYPTIYAEVSTHPRLVADGGNLLVGTVDPGNTVHAMILRSNATLLQEAFITESEVLAPTWFIDIGTAMHVSGSGSDGAGVGIMWAAFFSGASAELTNAQTKTLLQTLGWTVAW